MNNQIPNHKHQLTLCRMLSLLMILTMLVFLLQPSSVAAATQLNYTEKMITVDQTFNLKISSKKKNISWTSSKPSVATVSKSGKVKGKSQGTATITATIGKKTYKCKVYVASSTSSALYEINSWLTKSIWNEGFCDFGWYYSDGTNNCGEKMNIDYSISKFKKNYKKFDLYEDYIDSLKGSKYSDLKDSWEYMRTESDTLYKQVVKEIDWSLVPYDDEAFNNELFNQYFDDVYDYLSDLCN